MIKLQPSDLEPVREIVRNQLLTRRWHQVWNQVDDRMRVHVWTKIGTPVESQVWDQFLENNLTI